MQVTRNLGKVLLVMLFLASIATEVPAQSARDIIEKQRSLHTLAEEQETLTMTLVKANGESKKRKIVRFALTDERYLSKILTRFLAPRDVENTGILIWERTGGEEDQWLYIPALRKSKRIASTSKKNRFMGSDFAYEDLRSENVVANKYRLVASDACNRHHCWVIEAVPATRRNAAKSGYSRRKLWIRKDIYYTVKEEYYDKSNKLEKIKTNKALRKITDTLWRADEIEMHDVQMGTRTVVRIQRRVTEQGLDDDFFTLAELEEGGN